MIVCTFSLSQHDRVTLLKILKLCNYFLKVRVCKYYIKSDDENNYILVVPDTIGSANNLTEEKIAEKNFELIFSFDEAITYGGYKEPINVQQIRTNLEMESHEEKLFIMVQQSKMDSAKESAHNAAKVIRERQKEQQRLGITQPFMQGIGSNSNSGSEPIDHSSDTVPNPPTYTVAPTKTSGLSLPVKGMSLTGGKGKSLEDALVKEDKLAPVIAQKSSKETNSSYNNDTVIKSNVVSYPVLINLSEKMSAKISREGLVESFEIKGNLNLTINNADVASCTITTLSQNNGKFVFVTSPKINKPLYEK